MTEAIVNGPRDHISQRFTVTNFTEALSLDCSGASNNALGDALGTLIQELKAKGIIDATLAA